jgi:Transposase DDE domain group 1
VARDEGAGVRLYVRADAAFASPEIDDYLEAHGLLYSMRLPSHPILQKEIEPLLKRPVGRPPQKLIVWYDDCWYQAASWEYPRRVVAKVEWHQGELCPRIGFPVTSLWATPEGVVHVYHGRGIAEQWMKEGKYALQWTRLSCHRLVANQVRLQLFILAYNLGNFLRRLTQPKAVMEWSLRRVQLKLIKTGARLVRHARRLVFQMAEVAVSRDVWRAILERIGGLRLGPG